VHADVVAGRVQTKTLSSADSDAAWEVESVGPPGTPSEQVSVTLCWNRDVAQAGGDYDDITLDALDLRVVASLGPQEKTIFADTTANNVKKTTFTAHAGITYSVIVAPVSIATTRKFALVSTHGIAATS